jgi:hypothetical protein
MKADVAITAGSIPTVDIPDVGTVTLATLDQLRASRAQMAADTQAQASKASELKSQADQRFADAGAIIVPRESEAKLGPDLKPQADRARQLVEQIKSLDGQLGEIEDRPHTGLRGTFARLGDWNASKKISGHRDNASDELRQLLIAIGRRATDSPVADAATAAAEGADLDKSAAKSQTAASAKAAQVAACDAEINRRETSVKEMGFDALYTAAYLSKYPPPSVASPLELKRGEQALLSMPATLSRIQTRTHYVGGSQGFSFPIGHTGIRYRVGSFHGHPVSQQLLTQIDRGSVVVTSQRIAFVGSLKSLVVPLPKVVHIEVYNDGLAVFHEGRENADYFLCGAPKQLLFYVNWALNQQAS